MADATVPGAPEKPIAPPPRRGRAAGPTCCDRRCGRRHRGAPTTRGSPRCARPAIDARLCLGQSAREAFLPHQRSALRTAPTPATDSTKVVGLIPHRLIAHEFATRSPPTAAVPCDRRQSLSRASVPRKMEALSQVYFHLSATGLVTSTP
ncbi:hypothetical protein BST45_18625 [Mycobacterium shinjukuense]|nr:hypothetical protein BST45_18625 [Mycobacterium shinjukuense]